MKFAIVEAVKAFVKTAKQNHLDYCKRVVAKAENPKPKTTKKESK